MNEPSSLPEELTLQNSTPSRWRVLRLRFPLLCLLGYWLAAFAMRTLDKLYFVGFLYGLASAGLVTILFLGWWAFNRGLRASDKWIGLGLIVGEAFLVGKFSHHSITYFTVWMAGVPVVASAIVAWLFLARKLSVSPVRLGFAVVVTLAWSYFLLIRTDGADARLNIKQHWRWTPTAEEQFLAHSKAIAAPGPISSNPNETVVANESAGDWTNFRGAKRDGVIRGTTIATNWNLTPPVLVWKKQVGPAWSSLLVIGNRIFTQEQRGENEAVVCYGAASGNELWVHQEPARFDESVSGPGPRATPTFAQGRIYALGGTGVLNCLDAATGKCQWKRDIKDPSGAKVPIWAFASSPLVTGDLVIVYAGGDSDKGLLAYRIDSGDLAWAAPAGTSSYSSPQRVVLSGVPQCLMLHDGGLSSVDLKTGTKLWETGLAMKGAPRCGQPRLIGESTLLVGALDGLGCSLIEVSRQGEKWLAASKWKSKDLKPEFPDLVVQRGYAYGFDVGIFCCLNLADGKRAWKDGRYGRGQVMLLADQDVLLVISEAGELICLAAHPKEWKELGRFQALEGKTWNHPVVRGDRVYLRNAQEMACYTISGKSSKLAWERRN